MSKGRSHFVADSYIQVDIGHAQDRGSGGWESILGQSVVFCYIASRKEAGETYDQNKFLPIVVVLFHNKATKELYQDSSTTTIRAPLKTLTLVL